jgi:8-oxo-dGTP diphosphatase
MTNFTVAAHGIIRKDDKILTTRRAESSAYKPLVWDFPGGKINPGETVEEGLLREIQEETKLEVTIHHLDYVFTSLEELPGQQHFQLLYECTYQSGEVTVNPEEHDEYQWVTLGELKQKDNIHFVKDWLEYKNKTD